MKCFKCGKRRYVFRNKKHPEIKCFWCPNCKEITSSINDTIIKTINSQQNKPMTTEEALQNSKEENSREKSSSHTCEDIPSVDCPPGDAGMSVSPLDALKKQIQSGEIR